MEVRIIQIQFNELSYIDLTESERIHTIITSFWMTKRFLYFYEFVGNFSRINIFCAIR